MNYSELKTNISTWMHRDDLTNVTDTFIDLFESRANKMLRVPEMEETATSTPTDQYIALPSDFLEIKHLKVNYSIPVILQYTDPQTIEKYMVAGGNATFYSIIDNQIVIAPSAAGTVVDLVYYERIPALSDSVTTNWLINNHEDYYLLGVMVEAYFYTMDDRYERTLARLVEKESFINLNGKAKVFGRGPLVITPN